MTRKTVINKFYFDQIGKNLNYFGTKWIKFIYALNNNSIPKQFLPKLY